MNYISTINDQYLISKILSKSKSYYLTKDVVKYKPDIKEAKYIEEIDNSNNKLELLIKYNYIDLIEEYINKIKVDRVRNEILNKLLIKAVQYNNKELIIIFIDLGANNW